MHSGWSGVLNVTLESIDYMFISWEGFSINIMYPGNI